MTQYLRNGNSFQVTAAGALNVYQSLPVGTYVINQDMQGTFYFEMIADFEQPKRVYGSTLRHVDRIMNTFVDRSVCTGVMLAGEKGSGKSLLAKMLSVDAAKRGYPTIVINQPWCGDGFNKLMQNLDQPAVVLFDEFEKVYDSDHQESILTLFDGMFPTKKMFVLTCNDKWRVDQHMRNRPGRIYYMLNFDGLEVDFIIEYCNENLLDKTQTDGVVRMSGLFSKFNFDMLKAMVEEMNRYSETAQEVMALLNTKPEYSDHQDYTMTVTLDGVPIEKLEEKQWRGNPLTSRVAAEYYDDNAHPEEDEADNRGDWVRVVMNSEHIKQVDGQTGKFVFQNGRACVVLKKVKEKEFDYSHFGM